MINPRTQRRKINNNWKQNFNSLHEDSVMNIKTNKVTSLNTVTKVNEEMFPKVLWQSETGGWMVRQLGNEEYELSSDKLKPESFYTLYAMSIYLLGTGPKYVYKAVVPLVKKASGLI